MVRICPNCGRQAIDEQSQFCNKCGTPFPAEQTKKILVRTNPRLADTPPQSPQQPIPPPVMEPPADQYQAPAAPPTRARADPLRVRVPAKTPVRRQRKPAPVLPFRKFLGKDFIRPVYWIGVIAILMVVFSGISADLAKKGTATGTATETAVSGDILAGIPLFWIGVMLICNLFWRILCETCAIQFAVYDSLAASGDAQSPEQDSLFEDEMPDMRGAGDSVECPRCGKVVAPDELRACAHCGVQGCSSCIRLMGLVRKTLTCRDCYQRK